VHRMMSHRLAWLLPLVLASVFVTLAAASTQRVPWQPLECYSSARNLTTTFCSAQSIFVECVVGGVSRGRAKACSYSHVVSTQLDSARGQVKLDTMGLSSFLNTLQQRFKLTGTVAK
jgi:hypothetical protein